MSKNVSMTRIVKNFWVAVLNINLLIRIIVTIDAIQILIITRVFNNQLHMPYKLKNLGIIIQQGHFSSICITFDHYITRIYII